MGRALLIIVLGFSTIFGGMMFNVTSSQQRSSRALVEQYKKIIARNAKESISNVVISKAIKSTNAAGTFSFGDVSCELMLQDITADSTTEAKKSLMTIVCTYDGVADSTTIVMMRPAYSYYYYFVDGATWLSDIIYTTGDTLVGAIHANTSITIDGNPVFFSKVSSTASGFNIVDVMTTEARAFGGVEFGIDAIHLPNNAALVPLEQVITAGGHLFAGADLHLTFKADSSYDWTQGAASGNSLISARNGTIMLTGTNNIHIKGVVGGQVTILAEHDIVVDSSIVYLNDPRSMQGSNDYLGLIAKHNIRVKKDFTNVEIDAAMMALNEFKVDGYSTGGPKGTLTMFGSLAVYQDRPSGVVVGGTVANGYLRNHVYDLRLKERTPPYFPRLLDRKEVAYINN
ncbi:MAG: hypothetical protein ACE5IY_01110 [bacterium]